MKKFLVMIVLAISAISANAQVTWNVRGGLGIGYDESLYDDRSRDFRWEECIGTGTKFNILFMAQANIPFKQGGKFTFSPSINYSTINHGTVYTSLPIGYKIPFSKNFIFFPKIGIAIGIIDQCTGRKSYYIHDGRNELYYSEGGDDNRLLFGPSIDLAFELNHFVIGVTGCMNALKEGCDFRSSHLCLTAGYKF